MFSAEIELEIEFWTTLIYASTLDVPHRINDDRVANTDQTIAVSKVVLMF